MAQVTQRRGDGLPQPYERRDEMGVGRVDVPLLMRLGVRSAYESIFGTYEFFLSYRRRAWPEDIAHIVAFLASEDASFITGEVIYATAGPKSAG